jgi:hypothetical protein
MARRWRPDRLVELRFPFQQVTRSNLKSRSEATEG